MGLSVIPCCILSRVLIGRGLKEKVIFAGLNNVMQPKKKIAIVGSGLVGTLLAIYLKQLGKDVWVFDRRPTCEKSISLVGP